MRNNLNKRNTSGIQTGKNMKSFNRPKVVLTDIAD